VPAQISVGNAQAGGDSVRLILNTVGQFQPPLRSIAEESYELVDAVRGGDDDYFSDIRQHERGERIFQIISR